MESNYNQISVKRFFDKNGVQITERSFSNGLVTRKIDYSKSDWYLNLIKLKSETKRN